MKKTTLLLVAFFAISVINFAQTAKPVNKTYQMYNTNYMMPKRGQEKLFEAGVKAHIAKYHTGPFSARLSVITEGAGSDGWYVWTMGPMTYTDMDHQPDGNKEHDDDWSANVDSNVEKYGESNLWKLNEELSYTPPNYNPSNIDVWGLDIKQGMRYKFNDLMKKWKALWEAKKYTFSLRVFNNDLWSTKGNNASIVFSFDKYAEFDQDISWRNDYEAMYGAGSWDNFWSQWNECVLNTNEQLRKFIK
jgi:hypothetical protein